MTLFPLLLLSLLAPLAAQTADELLNRQVLHEIRLTMLPADWQALHDNYLEDTTYPCAFSWNGYTLDKIGIKSRGSQSRSPIKPSIGLDFSKYTSSLRFAGLKTLVLRNLNQDASMMHEFLSEAFYDRMGLPHSRVAFARLYVNGNYAGVYLMVEPIDARFVKVRLGEDTGYLYSVQNLDFAWRFEYLGSNLTDYVPGLLDPKTNTADPDAAGIEEMIRQINQVHDNDFVSTVNRYVDLDALVAHAAVENAVANWDGLLGVNGVRNLYLYRWAASRRTVFFGWDMDGAFFDAGWPLFTEANKNVLLRRALQVPDLRRKYIETLDAAAHALSSDDWLYREIAAAYALIREANYADPFKLCRTGQGISPCTNQMFEDDVAHLLQFAYVRPAFIWKELAAELSHDAAAPDLRPGQAIELSSESPALVPESLAMLRTPVAVSGPFYASGYPLPTDLAGVRVETAAGLAQLLQVCETGITFVVPALLPCGPQLLRVIQNGHVSNALVVDLRPTAAVVFGATHADGSLVTHESPAVPGEWIVLYATGVWPGQIPAAPATLTIQVSSALAKRIWAGQAPGLIGMQQIVFEMPEIPAMADTAPLVLLVDGEGGKSFPLPVRR